MLYDEYHRMIFVRDITLTDLQHRLAAIPGLGELVAYSAEEDDPAQNDVPSEYGIVIDLDGPVEDQRKALELILVDLGDLAISEEQAWMALV